MGKACGRYASRYLIPIETFCAVVLLSWGFAGMQMNGALPAVLDAQRISAPWSLVLCTVALLQLVGAVVEGFFGRRWSDESLLFSVSVRCVCAFFSVPVWMYVLYFATGTAGATFMWPLLIQALIGLAWQMIIFAGNVRTRCLLDPKISTQRLERQVRLERYGGAKW